MRRGEVAHFRPQSDEAATPTVLHLLNVERTEDLLGDRRLLRTTIEEGAGWHMPQAGTELRVRFAWQALPAVPSASSQPATAASGAAEQGPAEEDVETKARTTVKVVLAAPAEELCEDSTAKRELLDLQRLLLRRYGGCVVVCSEASESSTSLKGPVLRVEHAGTILAGGPSGLGSLADALAAMEADANSQSQKLQGRGFREVSISVEEGHCRCSAEDWIPGAVGLRVLADLRLGQRCLVRLDPDVIPPLHSAWLQEIGVQPDAAVEYDIELLQILTLQDVSLDKSGRVMKKTLKESEEYELPTEGAEVTVRLEVRDDTSGAVLVEERELHFPLACGKYCSALEETLLTMKRGQVCEVRCSDTSACSDSELGLAPVDGHPVVLRLELLDFQKVDLYGLEEDQRVEHCARRKEVGTHFFQQGLWHRALRRYQHVTSNLTYLDHWKNDVARREALVLRRACHLNAAACSLKLEAWREAELSCDEVLREEPDNVKALFRRGQALKALGEFREAERNFRKVLEADKDNKEAARMLVKLRQSVKSEVEQQKEMFSRMAKGLGVDAGAGGTGGAQEQEVAPPPDSPAKESLLSDDDRSDVLFWGITAAVFAGTSFAVAYAAWRRWRR